MLFDTAALRSIESEQEARLGEGVLMQRAGRAIARVATTLTGKRAGPVVVVAGPGNNGGDARVAADLLMQHGLDVSMIDASDLPDPMALASRFAAASLIIDGLFGIGLSRPVRGPHAALIDAINRSDTPVLSIDVPSGIDADAGTVVGDDEGVAVKADVTIALIGGKAGLHMGSGSAHAGRVIVDTLGLELDAASASGWLMTPDHFPSPLRPREADGNKGSFGTCVLVGGSPGMAGAITLSARAALHGGAGRTVAHRVGATTEVDWLHPEIMWRPLDKFDPASASCVVIGPGLGTDDEARQVLERAWAHAPHLVVDADGLTLLARHPGIAGVARPAGSALCLTPHPLEAARLLDSTAAVINRHRIASALALARRFDAQVVLKGQGSVVVDPASAQWFVNPTGNAGLASGGTGDALAGFVGALLCRPGNRAAEALRAAVWIHGAAADDLVSSGCGPVGLTASELIVAMRTRLNRLTATGS